jgi:phospholipid/cholesterol/gamma-HCH transport system permease protein
MATATTGGSKVTVGGVLLRMVEGPLAGLGDLSVFAFKVLGGSFRKPYPRTLVRACFSVGVQSIPVVCVTGLFIGMVLGVQSYDEFASLGLATRLGQIINISVVRELGPVLAATMLAGRIGSSMAAELGTMRVTEQIDALAVLGTNPIRYLVVPRFLACVLLIPLLTILADFMGVMGGAVVCTQIFHVNAHHYWQNTQGFIQLWDIFGGCVVKPTFFGAAIGIIGCYCGFHSKAGAEGVGRAATTAFVASFMAILVLDFFLALLINTLQSSFLPETAGKIM